MLRLDSDALTSLHRLRNATRAAVPMVITNADLAAAMARAFAGMNAVFDRFDLPENELELMSRGFVEVLQQAGMA